MRSKIGLDCRKWRRIRRISLISRSKCSEFVVKGDKKSHNTKWHHEANEKKGSQRKSRLQKIKPSIKRSKQQQISSNKIKVDCTFIHEEEQQQREKNKGNIATTHTKWQE